LYLVAAILLGCLFFYDIYQDNKKEKVKKAAKQLFKFQVDELTSITLTSGRGTIKLQKTGALDKKEWKIIAPIHASTETPHIDSLKDKLANLKYSRIIAESASDLTQFGLNNPDFIITYRINTEPGQLSFGNQTPIEDGYYARRGKEKKVYLIAMRDKRDLDKKLFDLRSKMLFTLSLEKIKRFVIERDTGKWTLIKKDGTWQFEDDEAYRINQQKVDSMIRRFAWAEASSFEKETVEDLEPFGLHKPGILVTLSDDKRSEEIFIGDPLKENNVRKYAKMKRKPQVVTINKYLVEDIPQNREALKEKK